MSGHISDGNAQSDNYAQEEHGSCEYMAIQRRVPILSDRDNHDHDDDGDKHNDDYGDGNSDGDGNGDDVDNDYDAPPHPHHTRATVDQDGDGDISKEEFVKNAMNSKFIHDMLVEKSQV